MRKALIATLGLATLGALASVQPAAAKYLSCVTHIFGNSRSGPGYYNYGWTILPGELQQCQWVYQDPPLKPNTPWKGTVTGFGKPIQDQKTVRAR